MYGWFPVVWIVMANQQEYAEWLIQTASLMRNFCANATSSRKRLVVRSIFWFFLDVPAIRNHGILVGGPGKTPLKNRKVSIGMMTATQYEWENRIDGNQTTNQYSVDLF